MLLAMITIFPSQGKTSTVLDVLESMRGMIATNPDCVGSTLAVEGDEGGSIHYTERWRTREALDRHLRSSLYCRVLEAMELSQYPPKVEFFAVQDIGGLDLIEQARLPELRPSAVDRCGLGGKQSTAEARDG
jgi:quinol monooxygenase YgiN